MKRALIFVMLVFSAGLLSAQPKFSIDPMELNLGMLYSGSSKTGRFTIKNIGTESLQIKYVQPSCGCTTVRKPQDQIKPGKSDYIDIEFTAVAGFRGKTEKYVFISTNDPTAQELSVKIFADVREELQPTSALSSIPLGGVPLGKEITQTISFKNITQKSIKVKDVETTSKNIKATSDKSAVEPSDTLTLTITVKPDKQGYAFESVVMHTDSNNQPKIEIKVSYIGVKEQ